MQLKAISPIGGIPMSSWACFEQSSSIQATNRALFDMATARFGAY